MNSHSNDLFHHIGLANLNANADDERLYLSDKDPKELDSRLQHKIAIANNWFSEQNGMIVNPRTGIRQWCSATRITNFLSLCRTQLTYWMYQSTDNNLLISFNDHTSIAIRLTTNSVFSKDFELSFLETLCCLYTRRLCYDTFITVCFCYMAFL